MRGMLCSPRELFSVGRVSGQRMECATIVAQCCAPVRVQQKLTVTYPPGEHGDVEKEWGGGVKVPVYSIIAFWVNASQVVVSCKEYLGLLVVPH